MKEKIGITLNYIKAVRQLLNNFNTKEKQQNTLLKINYLGTGIFLGIKKQKNFENVWVLLKV